MKDWLEITVAKDSRDAVIHPLKSQLLDYLTNQNEVVREDIPMPPQAQNLWLKKFGCFKDDPTFDDLESEIAAYRQDVDQSMGHQNDF